MLTRMLGYLGAFKKNAWLLGALLLAACTPVSAAPLVSATAAPAPTLAAASSTPTHTPRPVLPTPTWRASATPLPSPTEACRAVSGQLARGEIDTPLLARPMTYIVYLPACYAASGERHYPVLYLLHGQDNHEDQWLRLGVSAAADKLIASGDTAPFIMVLPYDPSNRQPGDYPFEDVFLQQLIPEIDSHYRTLTDPADRAVGGMSRGGAWALHLGLHHPDVFGSLGAHSPAIFYSDFDSLPLLVSGIPPEYLPRLFIDMGAGDGGLGDVKQFEDFLSANNIPHEWHEYPGYHEEKYWSAHVEEYLRWYAQRWGKTGKP